MDAADKEEVRIRRLTEADLEKAKSIPLRDVARRGCLAPNQRLLEAKGIFRSRVVGGIPAMMEETA